MARKRTHPPIPLIVVLLLVLIGGGTWWWWSSTQNVAADAQWQATGTVEAKEYQVASAIAGRITDCLLYTSRCV